MKKYLLILFILSLALSACASGSNSPSLIGSWKLTAYGPADSPVPAVEDAGASLTFNDDGTLTGNGGCNGLGGEYKVNGDQIEFGPIMSTLMACVDDARMTQEGTVTQVMTDTASYKIEGNTLTITRDGTVLVLEAIAGK